MDQQHPDNNLGQQLVVHSAANQELSIYDSNLHQGVEEDQIDLRALWRTLFRYRKLIAVISGIFILMALFATLLMRPVYTSSLLLEINTEGRNLVKFGSIEDRKVDAGDFLATQVKILESDAVANDVVKQLNLVSQPEFSGELKQRGLISGVKSVIGLFRFGKKGLKQGEKLELAKSVYSTRLSVSQVASSNLISISFDSFDPKLAAKIANQHAASFVALNDKRRFTSTSGAKKFLEEEIKKVQGKLETSEKRLTNFARSNGIVDVEDRNNILIVRLSQINQAIADVQNMRIDAETQYVQSKSSSAQQLRSVFNDLLIKTLRQEQAKHRSQYLELSKVYKKQYPLMLQLKAKIDELESEIQSQARKIVAGLKTTYEQLVSREATLRKELKKANAELLDLQDRAISYNILKREWEANKELYSGLLERTKEVGVAAGMELNVGSVIDLAAVPKSASSPKLSLNLVLAALAGLGCGLIATFLLALLDNTVNDLEQLQQISQLGHLGVTPDVEEDGDKEPDAVVQDNRKRINSLVYHNPGAEFSEAIQSVRTSLAFARAGGFPRTLMVTSSIAGEGKSTISMNLAISCAKSGMKVIVIETDLRRPNLHKVFDTPMSPGLSDYLVGSGGYSSFKVSQVPGLEIVVAGTNAPNPVDLLSSDKMRNFIAECRQKFDLVLLDCPPILGLADSIAVSKMVEATLFIVNAHSTPSDAVKNSIARLRMVGAPLIGTVLNKLSAKHVGYQSEYYRYEHRQKTAGIES